MEYTKGKWRVPRGCYDVYAGTKQVAIVGNLEDAQLIAAAPELYEALKDLPERKSILAEAAYTGGDIPKKWMNDRGHFTDGYNQALKDVEKRREQAIAKAEGKNREV